MVSIELDPVLAAVGALRLAGRWDVALALLAATEASSDADRLALAMAVAETEVDASLWREDIEPRGVLDRAAALLDAATAEPNRDRTVLAETTWRLDYLRMRRRYHAALHARDSSAGARLDDWAERLRATAPDFRRAGWAAFFGGVIADNLLEAPATAHERYTRARTAAEMSGDELLESYALRHLGDHAQTAGDLDAARAAWERSTSLRERLGFVPGTVAQRLTLAELRLAEGDGPGAAALATDVARAVRAMALPVWLANTADDVAARARETQ
jgi:hypothetical protein